MTDVEIIVRGGVVIDVKTSTPLSIHLIDYDQPPDERSHRWTSIPENLQKLPKRMW